MDCYTEKQENCQLSFNKNWREYEEGFGDLNKDFWAGLELMHTLTQRGQWEMRIDYQDNNKAWRYLHYNQFSVGNASEKYPLIVAEYSGSILNYRALHHNGMQFTTPDSGSYCAVSFKSGNWYKGCQYINLNQQPPVVSPGHVLFIEMKIRPKDCITQ